MAPKGAAGHARHLRCRKAILSSAMGANITIVGGGSTHWSPSLLVDFANHEVLADSQVVLMDLDQTSLATMEKLGVHIAERRGIPLAVRVTTDLDEALDGAQYVVSAFSVGGFASMRHDIEVPARYGVRQPVGDSVGPGGISRSLRSIPVLLEVARAMERRCPDALLINVTNPLTALCRAVSRETSIEVVGLCNEVVGLQFAMSLLFDVAMHAVDPVIAGVNHFPVATSLDIDGRDGFSMLSDAMGGKIDLSGPIWLDPPPEQIHWRARNPSEGWTKADVLDNLRVKLELFRRFGALPAAADTHIVEFLPSFVTAVSDFGRDWGVYQYGLEGHQAEKAEDNANLSLLMSSERVPRAPSGELVAPLLEGLLGGGEKALPMNLPNTGQVSNLPEGAVVECIGVCGPDGVRARDSALVPPALGEYLRRVSVSQELTVDAAVSGSRAKVLEAMFTDPTGGCVAYEHLTAMTEELLEATARWLPQFA
jgi:alpha-galactosidase